MLIVSVWEGPSLTTGETESPPNPLIPPILTVVNLRNQLLAFHLLCSRHTV